MSKVKSSTILDVRERDEFEAEHIDESINAPLSQFLKLAPGILNGLQDREVLIMCRSGKRAQLAAKEIQKLGYADKIHATVFEGGILEWKRQGRPTICQKKRHFPILRQVQLVAGLGVLSTTILGAFVNLKYLVITGFFGAGLTFAGLSGLCPMASLLELMPWNKQGN